MAGPRDQYLKEMHERFGYLATWIPNSVLRLGDVGVIHGHEYTRMTTLKGEHIGFDVRTDHNASDLQYLSSDSVSIQVKGAGDLSGVVSTVGTVAAGITIEFQRANATLFQANGCRTSSILNQDELKMAILERHEKGDWPNDYFVITELIKAQSATIFISSGAGARVELVAEGNAGIDQFKLADLNAGLKVARSSNIGTTIVAQASLTPLFRACGIKRRLFRRPQYTQRGETETPRVPSESQPGGSGISFEELSVQDILDT